MTPAVVSQSVYPAHLEVDLALRDGSTIHVRPVRRDDRDALVEFLGGLSEESRIFRFFSQVKDFQWAVDRFVDVDYRGRGGLVALRGDPERIVGHAFYAQSGEGRAEVALEVADALQGHGVGTALLGLLAQAAAANGIGLFEAEVLPTNMAMIGVFRDSGFPLRTKPTYGALHVEFPTGLSEAALARFDEREHVAAVSALRCFFQPRSIAVVGASRDPGTIGGRVFKNLLESGFSGPVYPVSPHPVVQSVTAYPRVDAVPDEVDLAVIVVPAAEVLEVALHCARKSVRALVVISAGFAESGEEGKRRESALLGVCRRNGIRIIGPNCMGILNTDPDHRLNATFAPAFPPPGRVGFMSQSGALGLAVIDRARHGELGISTFVSVGNKADVSGNDLLEYWENDPATDVVLLYLESFGNPRRFSRIARRLTRSKPVLAVKSGRSAAGVRATASHTGALLAASDAAVGALFEQSGVIRCDTLGEMFEAAALLSAQPPPGGPRVGIVTNAGGLGILCADALTAVGLETPELTPATRDKLAEFLPEAASTGNPVDMIASASGSQYERALTVVGASGEVDALIAIFVSALGSGAREAAEGIRRAAAQLAGRTPLLAVFTTAESPPAELRSASPQIPVYGFPEEAARALGRALEWSRRRSRGADKVEPEGIRRDEAKALIATALADHLAGGWLAPAEVARLLDAYCIPTIPSTVAGTPDAAGAAADRIDAPVALKALAPGLVHKTEAGGVVLDVKGGQAVRQAAELMAARLRGNGVEPTAFLVQPMASSGTELIVGVAQDPLFGAVVACGAGGTMAEVLKDVVFRLAPLTAQDAEEMLESLRIRPVLLGYRGAPAADVVAVKDLLLRVGCLADDLPAVAELDLNPVIAAPGGALVVDARVRIEAPPPRRPEGARGKR